MRTKLELDEKRTEAYARQGWSADGSRIPAEDEDDERRRVFAAGVEAGILYAMGHAGDPFQRQRGHLTRVYLLAITLRVVSGANHTRFTHQPPEEAPVAIVNRILRTFASAPAGTPAWFAERRTGLNLLAGLGCTLAVIGASLAGQYGWIPAPLAMIVAGGIVVFLGMNLAYQLGVKAGRDQS